MMRITNNMMRNTSKLNINNNKVSVDRLNTQMSTQKKIVKPSDNPLIAIKSLRLSTTLSMTNQYLDNNIKDAQSWMDVTETALSNMKDILHDAYQLCVNGSTDTLTDEDRQSILEQLKGLSAQLYSEANADYADRTVFSGYKTDSTVTFTDSFEASQAKYDIEEQLSSALIEAYRYYANQMDTPTGQEVDGQQGVGTPEEVLQKRLRLAYDKLKDLHSFYYNYTVDTTSDQTAGTTSGNVQITHNFDENGNGTQEFQWRCRQKDGAFTYMADSNGQMTGVTMEDYNGYTLNILPEENDNGSRYTCDDPDITQTIRETEINGVTIKTYTFTDPKGNTIFQVQETVDAAGNKTAVAADSQGNRTELGFDGTGTTIQSVTDFQGNVITTNGNEIDITKPNGTTGDVLTATANGGLYELHTGDKDLTTNLEVETMHQTQFEEYLAEMAADPTGTAEKYKDTLIFLPDSGEMILGSQLAENFMSENATLGVGYSKEGFLKGETRPEMYFNCTNRSDPSPANHITYTNYDKNNDWIHQYINYAVSANQDMAINTQIRDVLSADCYRDLVELTDIVQASIDAHATVANIEAMLKSADYAGEDQQAYLKDCLEKAKKQMGYFDDHLQKTFGTQISRFEDYKAQVNLKITDVGTRGDQLSLAENRMENQKTTFKELRSNNEDEELSDVEIDYSSAYYAYQASLQAAGKIEGMSLLDFL